jgi:hypothetical protein
MHNLFRLLPPTVRNVPFRPRHGALGDTGGRNCSGSVMLPQMGLSFPSFWRPPKRWEAGNRLEYFAPGGVRILCAGAARERRCKRLKRSVLENHRSNQCQSVTSLPAR